MPSRGRLFRPFSLVLLCTLAATSVFGQEDSPFFLCQSFGKDQGLPDEHVRCAFEDSRGLLWIGTEYGVSSFDGRFFRTYLPQSGDDRIGGNTVMDIAEDLQGRIWLASLDGGLTCIDPNQPPGRQSRRFFHEPGNPASLPSNRLHAIELFDHNHLLLSAEGAPFIFLDLRTLRFSQQDTSRRFHPGLARESGVRAPGWCHSISRQGALLTLCFLHGSKVYQVDPKTGNRAPDFPFAPMLHPNQTVTCAKYDEEFQYGGGWFTGLLRWSRKAPFGYTILPVPDEVTALHFIEPGLLLAGTRNKGLFFVNTQTMEVQPLVLSPSPGEVSGKFRVFSLTPDRSGAIWAGTSRGLLRIWREQAFQASGRLTPLDPDSRLASLWQDEQGRVHTFTSKGWYVLNPATQQVERRYITYRGNLLEINAIRLTKAFGAVLGTESGLFFWNEEKKTATAFPPTTDHTQFVHYRPSVYDFLQVNALEEDTLNGVPVLLTGVLGYGLTLVNLQEKYLTMLIQNPGCDSCIQSNLVRDLARDRGGYWIGTSKGLYFWSFDGKTFGDRMHHWIHNPVDPLSLPAEAAHDIHLDTSGVLWVATQAGLCRVRSGKLDRLPHPLNTHRIQSLVPLADGRMLLSSPDGWQVFQPENQEFVPVYLPGSKLGWKKALQLRDGRLYLTSGQHWAIIPSDALTGEQAFPIPYLADLRLRDTRVDTTRILTIGYNDYFSFRLSALGLAGNASGRIEYRWLGGGGDWQAIPVNDWLHVSDPAPGQRVLQCRVLRPDGQEVWRKDLLTLEVRPPFWRTLWFVLLMMGILVAMAYGIFRYQLEQIRTRERIRSRIASDLHDEVGSALGSILLGSELAMRHTPAGGEKALELLENIRGTTFETLESMADIIWSIHPKNDGGDKLSERMRQTLRELLEASDVEVTWEAPPGFESLTFSMDARRNLLRLFKEAIHNIAKHAQATRVQVVWNLEGKMLTLSIADNGRGFIPGNSAGHGLDSMKQRAEALRGKFALDSAPGMGTRVMLSVPFRS